MDRLRNLLSVVSNRIGRRNNETSYFCTHLRKTSASQTRNFLEEKSPMPKLNKFLFILPNLMNALEWPALGDSVRPRVSSSVHWRRKLNLPKRFGGRWKKDDWSVTSSCPAPWYGTQLQELVMQCAAGLRFHFSFFPSEVTLHATLMGWGRGGVETRSECISFPNTKCCIPHKKYPWTQLRPSLTPHPPYSCTQD